MKTSCKECCFAKYEDITQTGCELGIVEKLEDRSRVDRNLEILECYDKDREFFVINGIQCPYERNSVWEKHFKDKKTEQVLKELQIDYHAIILVDKKHTIEDVKNILGQIQNQEIKPSEITVIRCKDCPVKQLEISNYLGGSKIKWNIQNRNDDNFSLGVDQGIINKKQKFILVIKPSGRLENDLSLKINKRILDIKPFSAIVLEGGYVINIGVYKFVRFHYGIENMIEKILELDENAWIKYKNL